MGILDTAGYYYLMGGDLMTPNPDAYANDIWRSTFSFHDLPAVATNCKLTLPAAGAGLRCWPGNDGCAGASVSGSGSASSGLSAAGIVGIVAMVLVVAVGGFFGWRYWQRRQAQKAGAGVLLGGTGMGGESFLGTGH